MKNAIRIGNCSGFFGDHLNAARELIDGGPIDVLTGDYLAELTMGLLSQIQAMDENLGYAHTFLQQLEDILADCIERKIKIVVNAGGLNSPGLKTAIEAMAQRQNLTVKVAYISGDNLKPRLEELQSIGEQFTNLETNIPLSDCDRSIETANAYLGGWGIKEALDQGADIVIAPRVTDAALTIGPAAWKFNWSRDNYDALAGALTAGHIIECSGQATGGNYAFFKEVPSFKNLGMPIAEMYEDGSFIITKHLGTGGLVSPGTVISQILYESSTPEYYNPDVIAHFDTMTIEDQGNDRVLVSGIKGSSPTPTHKVCINTVGGYRNTIKVKLTGLDIEEKAKLYADLLFDHVGGRERFDEVTEDLIRTDKENASRNEDAMAELRITVKSQDRYLVNSEFVQSMLAQSLMSIPGNMVGVSTSADLPTAGLFMVHWPTLIDSRYITEYVHINDSVIEVKPSNQLSLKVVNHDRPKFDIPQLEEPANQKIPLGRIFGTRSGDKGGHANVGIWANSDNAFQFLYHFLSVEKMKTLFPDMKDYQIERYELPNIRSLNFVIKGFLDEGVASSPKVDGQAKTLGEYVRAKTISVPDSILP